MSKALWWAAEAAAIPSPKYVFRAPLAVLIGEAVAVAQFVEAHGRRKKSATRGGFPTLERAGDPRLVGPIAVEIGDLIVAVNGAQTAYLAPADLPDVGKTRRDAKALVATLRAALRWVEKASPLTQGERDAARANGSLRGRSTLAVAVQLAALLAMARPREEAILATGALTRESLERGRDLLLELREAPEQPRASNLQQRRAREARDRLLILLERRVRLVREAARFVFRDHPEISRTVTSAFERRGRARRRAKTSTVLTTHTETTEVSPRLAK